MLAQIAKFFADPWNIFGALGQTLFMSRFIIQWIRSEIAGRSVIPIAFWYCSLGGGVALLIYAIYRNEPIWAIGQGPGLIVYSRNLYLIYREKRRHLTVTIETPKGP